MRKSLIPSVASLAQLRALATTSAAYEQLLVYAAVNLGHDGKVKPTYEQREVDSAWRFLYLNAQEVGEDAVIGEVNHVRGMVS